MWFLFCNMIKLIKIPIWERKLLLVTYPSDPIKVIIKHKFSRDLLRILKEEPVDLRTSFGATFYDIERGLYVVWFSSNHPSNKTIIHETNHVTKELMKYVGVNTESESNAYTQEWLYGEIKKALKKA